MTRSFTILGADDQAVPVAAGFEVGFEGLIVRDGALDDGSGVAVAQPSAGSSEVVFSALPEVSGSVYALVAVISETDTVNHYPPADYLPFRVIPFREDGETVGTMGLKIYQDGVELVGILSLVQLGPGLPYVVSGWAFEAGTYSLIGDSDVVAFSVHWEVLGLAATADSGSLPPYSLDVDLQTFGQLDNRLGLLLQNKDDAAVTIARARRGADSAINSALGVCYAVPVKSELSGTWSVTAGTRTATGVGGAALAEMAAGLVVTLGDEHHEIESLTGDNAFSLVEVHAGGASAASVIAAPRLADPILREWSYVLTLRGLLPGATSASDSLAEAIERVEQEIREVCAGRRNLPGVERTDSVQGFAFAEPEPFVTDRALLASTFHHRGQSAGLS